MRKIYYGKAVYNSKEIKAVNKVLKNNRLNLIDGPHVKKLVERFIPNLIVLSHNEVSPDVRIETLGVVFFSLPNTLIFSKSLF